MNRDQIIDKILAERVRQQDIGYTHQHDDAHTPDEWYVVAESYVSSAREMLDAPENVSDALFRGAAITRWIQVAAVAIAAIESFERKYPNA